MTALRLYGELPGDAATRLFECVDRSQPNGCWLWTGPMKADHRDGKPLYGRFHFRNQRYRAHRIMWWVAYGWPPGPNEECMRICNKARCVRPEHLMLADMKVVVRRAQSLGNRKPSILTDDDVRAIRASTQGNGEVARMYKVSRRHVDKIRCGLRRRDA